MEKIKAFFTKSKSYIIYIALGVIAILTILLLGKKKAPVNILVDKIEERENKAQEIEERAEELVMQADDAVSEYFANKKYGR